MIHLPEAVENRRRLRSFGPRADSPGVQVRFGRQAGEVAVALEPTTTLVWTTALLHATEIQRGPGPRRVLEMRFRAAGDPSNQGASRDPAGAIPLVFPRWEEEWSHARQRLWGVARGTEVAAL